MWRAGVGWDGTVPEVFHLKWKQWQDELPYLRNFCIPRYHGFPLDGEVELHLSSDASDAGFASVALILKFRIRWRRLTLL